MNNLEWDVFLGMSSRVFDKRVWIRTMNLDYCDFLQITEKGTVATKWFSEHPLIRYKDIMGENYGTP